MHSPRIQRALISVSDKLGLAGFARGLAAAGVEIYSTGGTRKHLESEGIPVRDVSEYTGFPEMMDGRLKTLHPKVHGGILCRHDNPEDMKALAEHGILTFELVVVNLYPFEATVARKGVTLDEAIEQIDIGGPTHGARGLQEPRLHHHRHQRRPILGDSRPGDGPRRHHGGTAPPPGRRGLRPHRPLRSGHRRLLCRGDGRGAVPGHGHDSPDAEDGAAVRREPAPAGGPLRPARLPGASVVAARQLHGKELSYNNLLDLDSALAIVRQFSEPAAVVIKHNNPCGAAVADTLAVALQRAMDGDPLSAFGSVLGLNRTVDAATAEVLAAPGLFVEAIVAPHFDTDALEILTTKPKWKANVRLMEVGELDRAQSPWSYRYLDGGVLMQEADVLPDPEEIWQVVTEAKPTDAQMSDLRFAWEMVRHVKSQRHRALQGPDVVGHGGGPDEPRRFHGNRRQEGGPAGRRLGAGLRRLLPLPRLDREGRRGRRGGHHSARRLEERRGRRGRLQPVRHRHDLHRPAAFQALGKTR